jgi:hypothetical protein
MLLKVWKMNNKQLCKKVEKIFVGNLLEKSIKKYKIKEKV